jgi:hypothetical protein
MDAFFSTLGGRKVEVLKIASPFVTAPGVRRMVEWFGRRRTRIELLTNLSSFFTMSSPYDPIAPLLTFQREIGDRAGIRSHPELHAKLYLAGSAVALAGSSNLTCGGLESNAELNFLIRGRTRVAKDQLRALHAWFEGNWSTHGSNLGEEDLLALQREWQDAHRRMSRLLPEPRLGGDYWSKVQKLLARPEMTRKEAERILRKGGGTRRDGQKARNVENKLIFLRHLGLIRYDAERVLCQRDEISRSAMLKLVSEHLPLIPEVEAAIEKSSGIGYAGLSDKLKLPKSEKGIDPRLSVAVNWLEDLGRIRREDHGRLGCKFFSTEAP